MDKKSKKILMHYMDDTKRKLLSFEEIAYAKEHGAILEDLSISHEEAIRILTQSLKCISLSDAANSLLYSLSTRDMEYRYILASYIYAVSWLMFDRGRTDKVPSRLDRTFYNWVKYQGGGIWGGIGKPIFYLNEFAHMDKQTPTNIDKNICEIFKKAVQMQKGKRPAGASLFRYLFTLRRWFRSPPVRPGAAHRPPRRCGQGTAPQ